MRRKIRNRIVALTFAATLVLGGGLRVFAAERIADTVYHNGYIYTMTETLEETKDVNNAKKVDVVATKDGKIIFVGSSAEASSAGYLTPDNVGKIVDLKGKTMLPGLIDGHGHFPGQGNLDLHQVNLNSPPLGSMTCFADYVAALKKKAADTPAGDWVQGWGYDDTLITEMAHPTRAILDEVSTEHPVVVKHISEHMLVANSAALALAGITKGSANAQIEGVVLDANGEPTGLLQETKAMGLVSSLVPTSTDARKDIKDTARASQVYAAAGVTTSDMGGAIMPMQFPALQQALANDALDVRVVVHPFGYLQFGATEVSFMNRLALNWNGDLSNGFISGPSASTPTMGADITRLGIKTLDSSSAIVEYPAPSGLPDERFFLGAWKMIQDGSNQGYTGYFKNPGYYDWGSYTSANSCDSGSAYFNGLPGTVNIPKETLEQYVELYHKNGQSVEVHTNGSKSAELFVTALEKAVAKHPEITDSRHTSIHGQMMERQHLERLIGKYDNLAMTADMYEELDGVFKDGKVDDTLGGVIGSGQLGNLMKAQNLINSYYINHTYFWGDRHLSIFMGPGRGKNMNPAGWSVAYGQRFTAHNDTTVTPISPLRSVHSLVTRMSYGGQLVSGEGKDVNAKVMYPERKDGAERAFWNYDQRVNVLQALHAVTIDPAFQNKLEDRIGSIAVGKLADFTILDENIFTVAEKEPLRLADLRVASTIVGDKLVHGVLPGSTDFTTRFSGSYEQPEGVAVTKVNASSISRETADKEYAALPQGQNRLGTFAFTAEVTPEKSAVFQFNFLGNGATVAEHQLHKLYATQTKAYSYGKPSPDAFANNPSGMWWIASIEDPTVALEPAVTLDVDKTYIAFFVIRDNDAEGFDTDLASGKIVDPVTLATTGNLPPNGVTADTPKHSSGGSSSGCSASSGSPAYDLAVLVVAFLGMALIRNRRRDTE